MLSSLLLQKYLLKDARAVLEEDDKEQSCACCDSLCVLQNKPAAFCICEKEVELQWLE